ncbi:hypothetical protein [Rhizobium sp. S163]|uniref:hypothetical protein n=1 Tax=Rhizobium sp. S163 TaxID=3055039 RepID=UPI0025AA30E9|nr:hypothetical protein [Rhizobium sp. S163]MDM9644846.1 hypothetical protein [Rhizobium sp. S163]
MNDLILTEVFDDDLMEILSPEQNALSAGRCPYATVADVARSWTRIVVASAKNACRLDGGSRSLTASPDAAGNSD